jgi:hypothetical protein
MTHRAKPAVPKRRTTDAPPRTVEKQNWFTEGGKTFYRDGMVIREWHDPSKEKRA